MNYNKILSSNTLCILIAIFTFISSFVYYKINVIVTAVGGHYLFNAIDIIRGMDTPYHYMRILYPMILAGAMKIGGINLESARIVPKINK